MTSIVIDAPTGSGTRARIKAYSSFEPYELQEYLRRLALHLPDVAIEIERMSTSALRNRLEAEKDAPQADMILGWADTAAKTVHLGTRLFSPGGDADGYLRVTGFSTAIVSDPRLLAQQNVQISNWGDLAHPGLEGMIAFPNPVQSGAGFLALATLLQAYGEKEGWALLEAILRNAAVCPDSAWEPAKLTGEGTIAAGVTVKIAAYKRKSQSPQLCVTEPAGMSGAEPEVYAGFSSTSHPDVVTDILQWLCSDEANSIFTGFNKIILSDKDKGPFTIDVGHAVTQRARWLSHFESLMNGKTL
ncbi:ABC transporter substrate-binding protein [Pantoea ananatis]|uniref:ABC transporter substrate-binding protein n=1 Tax=Pantoea ananas TaxID=553 RepID=UPI002350DC88|nr:substrate-binding domain-containing protein [Pantoea ananatis]MDC7872074.1 ABC transporter substrate-binding protein [Pantoea ananatis]